MALRGPYRLTLKPVRTSVVTERKPMAADARRTVDVGAERDRSGTGSDDDPGCPRNAAVYGASTRMVSTVRVDRSAVMNDNLRGTRMRATRSARIVMESICGYPRRRPNRPSTVIA
jgi:hypothetical protein